MRYAKKKKNSNYGWGDQESRFFDMIEKTETCWLWKGYKRPNGYSAMMYNSKNQYVHRVSYQIHKGEIPEGLVIDHLCRVRHCANPEHLEAVTLKENLLRGNTLQAKYKNRDACSNGHKYTKETMHLDKDGFRKCRLCWKIYRKNASPEQRKKNYKITKEWKKKHPNYHIGYYQKNKERLKEYKRKRREKILNLI